MPATNREVAASGAGYARHQPRSSSKRRDDSRDLQLDGRTAASLHRPRAHESTHHDRRGRHRVRHGATLTKGEQSLVKDGKADVVLHSRRAFQDTIQHDAISAVQELCGRRVVAFMSDNHIDPDYAVEIMILEPEEDELDNRDGDPMGTGSQDFLTS
jgi:hypothetical protein